MAKLYNLARMTTSTTGTGTITLGSAVAGFLSFAGAGVSSGETVTYAIKDGSNSEIGRGVYTTSGTTLTRTVLKSTNSNNPISLSGSAVVFITAAAEDFSKLNNTLGDYTVALAAGTNVTADRTLTITTGDANRTLDISAGNATISAYGATLVDDADAATARTTLGVRDALTANRTYYVRTDGSDSNTGLANTSGGAFLTLQKAANVVMSLDLGPYDVTVNVGAGTYTAGLTLGRLVGKGAVAFVGDTSTPSNVVISVTSAHAVTVTANGWSMRGFKTVTTTSGNHIYANEPVKFIYGQWNFGACPSSHVCAENKSVIQFDSSYTISGGASYHWQASDGGNISRTATTTITTSGTPAFTNNFAIAFRQAGILVPNQTFSGTGATGARYYVDTLSMINTFGGGASYLPGNSAGSADAATYGFYV